MKQVLPLAFALAVGVPALAQGQIPDKGIRGDRGAVIVAQAGAQPVPGVDRRPQVGPALPRFAEGTPVVIVGEISSQPKDIVNEKKAQVAIGPAKMDFTLHLSDAKMFSYPGASIQPNDLVDKMWVRAEGTVMDDPRRIKVTRLQVIGKDMPSLQRSAFFRPGFNQGYIVAVAGSREIYPGTTGAMFTPAAMTVVGQVSSDTGTFETTRNIQVDAAGNTWTVNVPKDTPVFDTKGEKISVHEIKKGQWIRAHGWQTDELRMRGARVQNIGPEEAFRASTFYRAGDPVGYVERLPGGGVQFNPLQVTGVITAVNASEGSFTLKDDQGRDRVFFAETLTITSDGRPVDVKTLRQGQRVTIQGSEIGF